MLQPRRVDVAHPGLLFRLQFLCLMRVEFVDCGAL